MHLEFGLMRSLASPHHGDGSLWANNCCKALLHSQWAPHDNVQVANTGTVGMQAHPFLTTTKRYSHEKTDFELLIVGRHGSSCG